MSGGECGISEKKASLATLAAGLFYIGALARPLLVLRIISRPTTSRAIRRSPGSRFQRDPADDGSSRRSRVARLAARFAGAPRFVVSRLAGPSQCG